MGYSIPRPITDFTPEVYYCKKTSKKFVADGRLDKDFWADAEFTNDFRDILDIDAKTGKPLPPPRFRTRAKMLWDDDYLYIGAELEGDEIWAYVTERDDVIFRDNDFEIFIDTNSGTHEYYEFEMNALNTVWDLLLTKPYRDGGSALNAWDIQGLITAVHIDGELNNPSAKNVKWSCEVAMPMQVLKQNIKHGQTPCPGNYWRIDFSRVQWNVDVIDGKYVKRKDANGNNLPEDNWIWSPIGVINMHYPEKWGFLFFTENGEHYDIPEIEYKKWELRKLYYAEHAYYDEHGEYTADFNVLAGDEKYSFVPTIEITKHNFEISADNISIQADGRLIW